MIFPRRRPERDLAALQSPAEPRYPPAMCNEAYRRSQIAKLIRDFGETRVALDFPEGVPNFAPLDSIRITDRLEIVRTRADRSDSAPADPADPAAPLTAEMSFGGLIRNSIMIPTA
ncbi:hypothetical protein ACX0GZ_11795 [Sphingomonas aestuarii]